MNYSYWLFLSWRLREIIKPVTPAPATTIIAVVPAPVSGIGFCDSELLRSELGTDVLAASSVTTPSGSTLLPFTSF